MEQARKVSIVTGSAGGIGEATARLLAQRGDRVIVSDVRGDGAEAAAQRLRDDGLEATAVQADVADPASVTALVERTLALWGRIDVLVNNAGVESSSAFLQISYADYQRVMRVNVDGVWLCCQAVIPVMLKQKSGAIVNVSSVAGQRGGGFLGTSAYATSKGAVITLTKALAKEFAKAGILRERRRPGADAHRTRAAPAGSRRAGQARADPRRDAAGTRSRAARDCRSDRLPGVACRVVRDRTRLQRRRRHGDLKSWGQVLPFAWLHQAKGKT